MARNRSRLADSMSANEGAGREIRARTGSGSVENACPALTTSPSCVLTTTSSSKTRTLSTSASSRISAPAEAAASASASTIWPNPCRG
jgi:hypothetical protein